ncbi:gamma-glutamylcyclotransferase [Bacillus sinesaloumensis]|uniref:gamma-glutamylcyclotransferase n=1 Tax=Litchfieldia sinesaloumensis TaxID=1926280 RepID=UPI000988323A|nr:gamma-glutamylcyclotransferase family protein [Bacillus sinesaloumensis]
MKKLTKVFVYGTLRQHETNHYLIKDARCLSRQCWTNGILYDTGFGYPAMIQNSAKRVYGELYEVTSQQLHRLDQLEGYRGEGEDNHYERITQVVHTDYDTFEAYVYVYPSSIPTKLDEIKYGDWKCYCYLKQEELYYFAYGSCMDTERFQQAGIANQFERVIGRGIAKDFSLAFTRKAHDGGRADLIESTESAEGKVYLINRATLTYLFRREGVNIGIYRPAFIDVKIEDKTYSNVLTFLVIDKEEELAPPEKYMMEILRGSKGVVSSSYYQKLVDDLESKFGMRPFEEEM